MAESGDTDTGVPRNLQEYFSGVAAGPPPLPAPLRAAKDSSGNAPATSAGLASGASHLASGASHLASGASHLASGASHDDELIRLQHVVMEKDHAIFHATVSASDLQRQLDEIRAETESLKAELAAHEVAAHALAARELADTHGLQGSGKKKPAPSPEAQEEIDRRRKEWLRIQKGLEREHNHRKAELVQVRGQWFQTQQQLELESRARRTEGAHSSAKIATLERDLLAARAALTRSNGNGDSASFKRGIGLAAASIILVLAAGGVWTQLPAHAGASVLSDAPVHVQAAALKPSGSFSTGSAGSSQVGVQASLSHLNRALTSMGNRPPEEVLREVRGRSGDPSICGFLWNKGQPALLFGGDGIKQTLATSLGRCAVAVEKYK